MENDIIFEDEKIKVKKTYHNFDFIATIENKTNKIIRIDLFDVSIFSLHLPANSWIGILANEDGLFALNKFANGKVATYLV